jgi:hypothetical protein
MTGKQGEVTNTLQITENIEQLNKNYLQSHITSIN